MGGWALRGWVPWNYHEKTPHLQLSLTILASPLWCKMRKLMAQHNNTIAGDHRWVFPKKVIHLGRSILEPYCTTNYFFISIKHQKTVQKKIWKKTHTVFMCHSFNGVLCHPCLSHRWKVQTSVGWFKITERGHKVNDSTGQKKVVNIQVDFACLKDARCLLWCLNITQ